MRAVRVCKAFEILPGPIRDAGAHLGRTLGRGRKRALPMDGKRRPSRSRMIERGDAPALASALPDKRFVLSRSRIAPQASGVVHEPRSPSSREEGPLLSLRALMICRSSRRRLGSNSASPKKPSRRIAFSTCLMVAAEPDLAI